MEFYPTQYLIYKPNEEDNEREVIFIREDDLYTVCFFEGAVVNLEREKLSQEGRVEGAKLGVRVAEDSSREEIEKSRMKSKDMLEGVKVGVEIAKELSGE